jgi:hypothetical protein
MSLRYLQDVGDSIVFSTILVSFLGIVLLLCLLSTGIHPKTGFEAGSAVLDES